MFQQFFSRYPHFKRVFFHFTGNLPIQQRPAPHPQSQTIPDLTSPKRRDHTHKQVKISGRHRQSRRRHQRRHTCRHQRGTGLQELLPKKRTLHQTWKHKIPVIRDYSARRGVHQQRSLSSVLYEPV